VVLKSSAAILLPRFKSFDSQFCSLPGQDLQTLEKQKR